MVLCFIERDTLGESGDSIDFLEVSLNLKSSSDIWDLYFDWLRDACRVG